MPETREILEELRWTPSIPDCDLIMYLSAARSMAAFAGMCDGGSAEDGYFAASRDDTTINALELLHESNYDTGKALQALVKNPIPKGAEKKWVEEEQKRFVKGLRQYGKNFFKIRKELLPHKETSDLVEFYYLWKKTPQAAATRPHRRHRRQSVLRRIRPVPASSPGNVTKVNANLNVSNIDIAPGASGSDDAESDESDGADPKCLNCGVTSSKKWHPGVGKDKSLLLCAECKFYDKKFNKLRPLDGKESLGKNEEETGVNGKHVMRTRRSKDVNKKKEDEEKKESVDSPKGKKRGKDEKVKDDDDKKKKKKHAAGPTSPSDSLTTESSSLEGVIEGDVGSETPVASPKIDEEKSEDIHVKKEPVSEEERDTAAEENEGPKDLAISKENANRNETPQDLVLPKEEKDLPEAAIDDSQALPPQSANPFAQVSNSLEQGSSLLPFVPLTCSTQDENEQSTESTQDQKETNGETIQDVKVKRDKSPVPLYCGPLLTLKQEPGCSPPQDYVNDRCRTPPANSSLASPVRVKEENVYNKSPVSSPHRPSGEIAFTPFLPPHIPPSSMNISANLCSANEPNNLSKVPVENSESRVKNKERSSPKTRSPAITLLSNNCSNVSRERDVPFTLSDQRLPPGSLPFVGPGASGLTGPHMTTHGFPYPHMLPGNMHPYLPTPSHPHWYMTRGINPIPFVPPISPMSVGGSHSPMVTPSMDRSRPSVTKPKSPVSSHASHSGHRSHESSHGNHSANSGSNHGVKEHGSNHGSGSHSSGHGTVSSQLGSPLGSGLHFPTLSGGLGNVFGREGRHEREFSRDERNEKNETEDDDIEQPSQITRGPTPPPVIEDKEFHRSHTAIFLRHWNRGDFNSCARTDLTFKPVPDSTLSRKREERARKAAEREREEQKKLAAEKGLLSHSSESNHFLNAFDRHASRPGFSDTPALRQLSEYARPHGAFSPGFPRTTVSSTIPTSTPSALPFGLQQPHIDPILQYQIASGMYGPVVRERFEMEEREKRERIELEKREQHMKEMEMKTRMASLASAGQSAPNVFDAHWLDMQRRFGQMGPGGPNGSNGPLPFALYNPADRERMERLGLPPTSNAEALHSLAAAERLHSERLAALDPFRYQQMQHSMAPELHSHAHTHAHAHTHLHLHPQDPLSAAAAAAAAMGIPSNNHLESHSPLHSGHPLLPSTGYPPGARPLMQRPEMLHPGGLLRAPFEEPPCFMNQFLGLRQQRF